MFFLYCAHKQYYLIMKLTIYFYILFTTILSQSQIPAGYYDTAINLTGYALKTELKNIISNNHIDRGYDNLYTLYQTSDNDSYYDNDNS